MGEQKDYYIDEYGQMHRRTVPVNPTPPTPSSGDDNSGCWTIIIIIGVIVGIILYATNSNGDSSDSRYESPEQEEFVEVEEDFTPATNTTYLSVSPESVRFDSDGGSRTINISTNASWYISTDTYDWGHITKYSDHITLRVDRNSSTESRTDYFVITAGDRTKQIDIYQEGQTVIEPTANIENIWIEHNIYVNGVKGMKVHTRFTVDDMNGKTIYGNVHIYYEDNTTPLHDGYGNNLKFSSYGTPNYDSCRFEDFVVFVSYTGLNMQPGYGSINLSFDVSITDSSGNQLARENNTSFRLSEN